ncbi:MAG TPA: large-conductance mechanosensitive channel protein MscL [Chitinophagales bacterium]|nr:large-conductance mechanosensitive channel protein MscL [Chitinophagales bacterium]HMW11885.1 large-conductance mechanosensitive channel protein MscL [Chitinophagales bacterium]HMX58986.1 large-conductance mechanosensitive channel protein MscL [Chitinophagales bacterium]HMY22379.1 large-conductance mechanosensitive channel protein MscL [Chitinophagales bacterium]HMZ32917.1 large-conductance mechanosensitive channel protein MscL [Chitinophagales bacterium]
MGMIKEFKEFAIKGNLIDMAVGVVMGGAFGKVVSTFIDGMVMPAIGMISGGVDFTQQKIILKDAVPASADGATPAVAEVAVKYGDFISQCITFLVVALVVFVVIKAINKMKKAEAAAPAAPPAQEVLLTEIRDLLKK